MDRSSTPRASAQQQKAQFVENTNHANNHPQNNGLYGGIGLNGGVGKRSKNRSRSGSEELSQIVAEAQANQRFGDNTNNRVQLNSFWPLSNSFSRPQSVTPTPNTFNGGNVNYQQQSVGNEQSQASPPQAGLLSWVRNTIMMGPSGRPTTAGESSESSSQSRSPPSSSEPIRRNQTPLLPGILPSFHHIDQQKSLEPPLIIRETPRSERSSISFDTVSGTGYDSLESYDYANSIRRSSTISISNSLSSSTASSTRPNSHHRRSITFNGGNGSELGDNDEDDESDQEDIYSPFAQKQHGPSLIRPTARREPLGFGPPSPSSTKEEEDLKNAFGHRHGILGSEHNLSVSEAAQESGHTFVTDTDEARTVPSVVISTASPVANHQPLDESSSMSPIAGWIEADFDHSPTPKPKENGQIANGELENEKEKMNLKHDLENINNEIERLGLNRAATKSISNQLLPNHRSKHLTFLEASYDSNANGDGEDLNDPLGRPKSPEELIRVRQTRERVVLGSQGANTRAGQIAPIRRARAASMAKEKQNVDQQKADLVIDDGADTSELGDNVKSKPLQRSASTSIASPQRRKSRFSSTSIVSPPSSATPKQVLRNDASEELPSSPLPSNAGSQRILRPLAFLGRRRERSESSSGSIHTHSRSTSTSVVESIPQPRKESLSFWKSRVGNGRKNSLTVQTVNEQKDDMKGKTGKEKDRLITSKEIAKTDQKGCALSPLPSEEKLHKLDRLGAMKGDSKPRRIKVRHRNKASKEREFTNLYLVQELFLAGRTPNASLTPSPLNSPSLKAQTFSATNSSQTSLAGSDSAQNQTAVGKRKATWAMKFSLDGKYLAVAGQDAIIRVYGVLDSPTIRSNAIQSLKETSVASRKSTDKGRSKEDQTINGKGIEEERLSNGDSHGVECALVFTPDPIKEFKGHTSDILDLCWSKGGFLLSASMDKTARVWHLSWPNNLVAFVHGDFVTCAVFHPRDDRFFLSGSLDGKLRLWNISTKKVQASQEVPGLITACAFTHSGNTACVGTFSGAALFYQTDGLVFSSSIAVRSSSGKHQKGGRKITAIEPILSDEAFAKLNDENGLTANEIQATNNATKVCKSIEERVLITSNDSRIRAYDVGSKSMLVRYKAKSYTNRSSQIRATLSEDNAFIISGSEATSSTEGGQVHIWASAQTLFDFSQKGLLTWIAMSGLNVVAVANEKTTNLLRKGSQKGGSKRNSKHCDKEEKKVLKQKDRSDVLLDDSVEYFTAHAGTVTCAIMAPAESNTHLRKSQDPLLMKADQRLVQKLKNASTTTNEGEGTTQIGHSISAPVKSPSLSSSQKSLSDKLNRILVTVDDQAILRIWRNDNLDILTSSGGKEK